MTSILFKFYRLVISPFFKVVFQIECRFEESCSKYTERKIKEKGFFRGVLKGMIRFAKCNPLYSEKKDQAEA